MSHLGELLSAHIDGELDGAERDKVSAHLARCAHCRAEASELRELKRQLSALATGAPDEADMLGRLLEIADFAALAGAETAASQSLTKAGDLARRHRVSRRSGKGSARQRGLATGPGGPSGPGGRRVSGRTRRRRYLVLGTVSIVMGLGTAAFSVGGGESAPGPRIVPQVELYSQEHAITTGGVPFDGPGPAMGPVMSAAASTASPAPRRP
jgi:anti-sigma factor RsiW